MKRRIVEEIEAGGPIPFERFMELALYDAEGGFFATGPLRSEKGGDFLTSPEISSAFGTTIGRYVEDEFERLGRPDDFTIVEFGAGSGSLLEPLLDALSFDPPVVVVEASPAARRSLTARFPDAMVVTPAEAPHDNIRGVVVANELADNLPMALAVRGGTGWTERWVGVEDGGLVLVSVPARDDVLGWVEQWGGDVSEGGIVEVQLEAGRWLEHMAARLSQGSIVVIDYGDTADLLAPRRSTGTLRTYRAHHLGPHPLDEPGATDITADVNFTALLAIGGEAGLHCELVRQDDFLTGLGLRDWLAGLRAAELDLARGDDTMRRLEVRNTVTEVETILHPRGLGDFRVLLCRTI